MKKLIVAALAALVAAQPASAATVLGDFDVYANGNAYISGGSYGNIASGSFSNANGAGGTNFSSRTGSTPALTQEAHQRSDDYSAQASTGTVTSGQWTPGDVTLTGLQNGINVFNIDGSQWSQLYKLSFAGIGDGAIVNISGNSLTNYVNIDYGALGDPGQVLFNFYDATNVTMNGMTIKGSILAPNALVTLQGGSVAGGVVGDSFHSEGSVIGGKGFVDFSQSLATAVPEPATWMVMILGFGVVGAALRLRNRTALRPATV